jgi:beta-glucosidase
MTLAPGEKKTAVFKMKISQFAFLDADMRWKVEAGEMDIFVGASSDDVRLKGSFGISEDAYVEGRERGFYAETHIVQTSTRDKAVSMDEHDVSIG